MAVFRVERNTGYTVMSNHHLRNKELSLKAKGLLSQMLSLPEDWDYTLAGLSYINREKIDATVLGEGGTKLSGGEKQRLSIARAIIKDAPIVLLDEVTANMDVENELMIQMALQELLQDKTVIMIAHKLSTIKNVDQILVLENGKITQRGTHDQLVSQDGLYQKLWNIQYEASSWSI